MLRQAIRILVCTAAIAAAGSLYADSVVRCESKGGRRICKADEIIGSVVMKHQRSMADCTEGESWGYTRDAIWVDHGCRADFQVFTRRYDRDRDRDRDRYGDRDRYRNRFGDREQRFVCESSGGRQFCAADTRYGVRLTRTFGRQDCVEGRSWGITDRGVWVDRGCRAEFLLGGERRDDRRDETRLRVVTCESDHNHRRLCAVDTRFGVEMKRQLSISDCTFNKTWGYDRYGIWVTDGCRAEFAVRER